MSENIYGSKEPIEMNHYEEIAFTFGTDFVSYTEKDDFFKQLIRVNLIVSHHKLLI
jgi:hypothetical protein